MAQISETELNNILIPTIIFSIITTYILIKFFKSSSAKPNTTTTHHLPPGPKPWPILGNIPHMLSSNPHITLFNLSKIYGPLIYLRLGTQPLIVASSPESAREIFRTNDRIFSGRPIPRCLPFTKSQLNQSSSVWTEDCNVYWKSVRTLCRTELFSNKAIESQAKLREKSIGEMVGFLRAKGDRVLKVSDVVFATVFNLLGNAMMSRDFIRLGGEEEKNFGDDDGLKSLSRDFIMTLSTPDLSDFYPIFGRFDVQGLRKKLRRVYSRFRGVWEPIIEERKIARARDDDSYYRCKDFLDAFLQHGFTNDQITLLFTELLVAGSDTTTSTVEWTLAEMLKKHDIITKARRDIEGEIEQDFPINSHSLKLPYLQACVKETLRLHPPAPLLLPHRATETCRVMNQYAIPKDAKVLVNAWAIGRDPDLWVEPLEYDPERFLNMDPAFDFKGSDFEFLPFGSGRRICPGMPFAAKNVPLILAALIHFFDWLIPQGNEIDMREKFGITIEMERPLMLIPRARR